MSNAAHLLDRRIIFRHDRDHPWNGCGTITTDGSTILASWYTGGYKEPHPDNHVVLSRSFDGGAAWEPPTVVSDPPGDLRAGDPMAWRDALGITHLTFGHHDQFRATGDWSYFHMTCADLAAGRLTWSAPARVAVMQSLPGRAQRSPLALHVSYNGGDDFSRIVILDPGVGAYPDAELDPDGRTLHILYEDRVDVFYAALDLNAVL